MTMMVRRVRIGWSSDVNHNGHVTLALQAAPLHLIASADRTTPPEMISPLADGKAPDARVAAWIETVELQASHEIRQALCVTYR